MAKLEPIKLDNQQLQRIEKGLGEVKLAIDALCKVAEKVAEIRFDPRLGEAAYDAEEMTVDGPS